MSFGQAAGLSHRTTYGPETPDHEISDIIESVQRFAAAGGLGVTVERDGADVTFHFDNYMDYLIVNEAFNPDVNEPPVGQNFTATQHFENRDQGYIDTWAYHAREYLDRLGVTYSVVDQGPTMAFQFDTLEAYTTFQAMREAGYFDRRTDARIGFSGPVEPGALPY